MHAAEKGKKQQGRGGKHQDRDESGSTAKAGRRHRDEQGGSVEQEAQAPLRGEYFGKGTRGHGSRRATGKTRAWRGA